VFHEDDEGYSDARESLPYHKAKQANLALQTGGSVAIRKANSMKRGLGNSHNACGSSKRFGKLVAFRE